MSSSDVTADQREQAGGRTDKRAGEHTDRPAGNRLKAAAEDHAEQAEEKGREAAQSTTLQTVGRLGLVCRGLLYGLIGVLALQVAFGDGGEEADSHGALRTVSDSPVGGVVLWLLAVGFAGLALWQVAEAAFAERVRTRDRWEALARTVFYGGLCTSVVLFLTGDGGQSSGDQQSQSLTARAMEHTGGRLLVGAVGLVVLGAGAVFAVRGLRRQFLENLDLDGASTATRRLVETVGLVGNVARGVVFCGVGVFGVQAAVTYDPAKAKGLDGSLHAFARTPLGPALLVLLALGLVVFGVYSCLQARWQRTRAAASA